MAATEVSLRLSKPARILETMPPTATTPAAPPSADVDASFTVRELTTKAPSSVKVLPSTRALEVPCNLAVASVP